MQLFDMSLTTLIVILFGIIAVFALLVGIRMPHKFTDDEKVRNELKKKIYSAESEKEEEAKEEEDQVS